MKREEMQALTHELMGFATPENQARFSEILTTIMDDHEDTNSHVTEMEQSISALTERNERLREVNTELFLKSGKQPPQTETTPPTDQGQKSELTYEKLFNEKGELI